MTSLENYCRIRITYTGVNQPHHMTFAAIFDGTPDVGVEPSVIKKDLTTTLVSGAVDELLNAINGNFNADTSFGYVEVSLMIDNESTPQFIYAFDAGGVLGTASPDQVLFAEQVTAFKTTTGKIVRQYWMEGASPVDQIFYPPFTGLTPLIAAADYFTGDDDIVVSNVDGSYPLTTLRSRTKTNDALRANAGLTQ